MYGEKVWWQLRKNDANCNKQVQEATLHKAATVWPPIIHLENCLCWRSKDELINDVLLWTPSIDKQWSNDQLETIYDSSVPIQEVHWKQWTIGTGAERGSGRSMLAAQHDDDDIIYIYTCVCVCVYIYIYIFISYFNVYILIIHVYIYIYM